MGIYRTEKSVEARLKSIERSKLDQKSKELIKGFCDECYSNGLSHTRVIYYLNALKQLVLRHYPNKPIYDWDKNDIKEVIGKIEKSEYAEWTKHGYRLTIKKFFDWLDGFEWVDKKSSDRVEWIRLGVKNNKHKLPEDILTEQEIMELVKNASNIRDKALISCLYESGCRIAEMLALKLKNVEFDEYGAIIQVFGKTGSRRIRLVTSVPHLSSWINVHPFKNNRESHLWVNNWYKDDKSRMGYDLTRKKLRESAKRAGIEKPVNPHSLRHSRATHLAKVLTEQQLKIFMGWTQSSKMASVYVHLSGKDVDNAILGLYGKVPEEKKQNVIRTRVCSLCGTENSFELDWCNRCHRPLTEKVIIEVEEKQKQKEESIMRMVDPKRIEEELWRRVEQKLDDILKNNGFIEYMKKK